MAFFLASARPDGVERTVPMPHNLSWPCAPGLKALRLPVSSYLLRTASGPAQSSMNLRPHHTGLPARLLPQAALPFVILWQVEVSTSKACTLGLLCTKC